MIAPPCQALVFGVNHWVGLECIFLTDMLEFHFTILWTWDATGTNSQPYALQCPFAQAGGKYSTWRWWIHYMWCWWHICQSIITKRMQKILDGLTRAHVCGGLIISAERTLALNPCIITIPTFHIRNQGLGMCYKYKNLGVNVTDADLIIPLSHT